MKKDFIAALLLFVFGISGAIITYQQYRHFYTFAGHDFTVWKRWGGTCYLMPYKYKGLSLPETDYMTLSNVGDATIFIKPDSSLVIFADKAAIPFFENYEYEFFNWGEKDHMPIFDSNRIYPCISFSIGELRIIETIP